MRTAREIKSGMYGGFARYPAWEYKHDTPTIIQEIARAESGSS